MRFDTKAFEAQDALVAALRAEVSLGDWQIDFGLPAGRPAEQHIWVDEAVDDWSQQLLTTGIETKNESFRLQVYLYDKRTDATAQEVRDEIRGAAAIIADVLGSAPFLSGVVTFAQIIGGQYEGGFADPEGRAREGVLKLTVECTGYLT